MSRIKEMVSELEIEQGFEQQEEGRKISVTGRISEEEVWRLDYVSKRVGLSRSGFAQELLKEGCIEAAEGLGIDLAELQALYISEKSKKPIEECREMLSKSGFFSVDSKEAK